MRDSFGWPSVKDVKVAYTATKHFAGMWVAGALGAYFGFLTVNAPLDLATLFLVSDRGIDWSYTAEVILRYGYVAWFLAYFFVSNFRHETDGDVTAAEVKFNVVQSLAAFIAAYFLGFLVREEVAFDHSILSGLVAANAAIAGICMASLWFFGNLSTKSGAEKAGDAKLNSLRALCLGISLVGGAAAFLADAFTAGVAWLMLALLAALWILWIQFRRVRVRFP